VSVVRQVTRPKPLPTPAATPCNSNAPGKQASTLLPSQHIAQEEPGRDERVPPPLVSHHVAHEEESDYNVPAGQHEIISEGHHDESSRLMILNLVFEAWKLSLEFSGSSCDLNSREQLPRSLNSNLKDGKHFLKRICKCR
jgi:hypothetical protein